MHELPLPPHSPPHQGFPFTFSKKCDILGNVIYGGVAKR